MFTPTVAECNPTPVILHETELVAVAFFGLCFEATKKKIGK